MTELRCKECNKLLAVKIPAGKIELKINSCQYTITGALEITCKCSTLNKI